MLRRDFEYTDKDRFSKIIVGSEDNFAGGDITSNMNDTGVNRQGEAVDPGIRSTRILQFQAEQSMNDAELKGRAEEDINIRRARGFRYQCTVPSHKYSIGKLIRVQDDVANISGVFLIRAVTYVSGSTGNTSQLTLCYPETYSGVGKRVSEKKSKMDEPPFAQPISPHIRISQEPEVT
jgi:prophage tail gpP-like protein